MKIQLKYVMKTNFHFFAHFLTLTNWPNVKQPITTLGKSLGAPHISHTSATSHLPLVSVIYKLILLSLSMCIAAANNIVQCIRLIYMFGKMHSAWLYRMWSVQILFFSLLLLVPFFCLFPFAIWISVDIHLASRCAPDPNHTVLLLLLLNMKLQRSITCFVVYTDQHIWALSQWCLPRARAKWFSCTHSPVENCIVFRLGIWMYHLSPMFTLSIDAAAAAVTVVAADIRNISHINFNAHFNFVSFFYFCFALS